MIWAVVVLTACALLVGAYFLGRSSERAERMHEFAQAQKENDAARKAQTEKQLEATEKIAEAKEKIEHAIRYKSNSPVSLEEAQALLAEANKLWSEL